MMKLFFPRQIHYADYVNSRIYKGMAHASSSRFQSRADAAATSEPVAAVTSAKTSTNDGRQNVTFSTTAEPSLTDKSEAGTILPRRLRPGANSDGALTSTFATSPVTTASKAAQSSTVRQPIEEP